MMARDDHTLLPARKRLDLAPLSAQPSTRLHLVALYFSATGTLVGTLLVAALVLRVSGMAEVFTRGLHVQPMQVIAALMSTAGLIWTGHELRQKRRSGWTSAIATLVLPILVAALGKSVSVSTLVTSVVGLVLVISVRDELQ